MRQHRIRARSALTLALVCCAVAASWGQPRSNPSQSHARLKAALDRPVIRAGVPQTIYLKVGLAGSGEGGRTGAVNLAFVIDRSGSMRGEKLRQAKEGAIRTVRSLRSDDVVSVIAFGSTADVLVPAARLDRPEAVVTAIDRLQAGDQTALYAGVSRGAEEALRFAGPRLLTRVILLSDGLANVGPSRPEDLAALSTSLMKQGVSVTTLGIGTGYHEDLMTRLAEAGDGNHMFVWDGPYLAEAIRQEIGDVLSAVAQDVRIEVRCKPGFVPVRVLSRDAVIAGSQVTASLRQLYGRQEKYVLLEIEAAPSVAGSERVVADVDVSLTALGSGRSERLSSGVTVRFSDAPGEVAASGDPEVLVAVATQLSAERSIEATRLRDAGEIDQARALLLQNAEQLRQLAAQYTAPSLAKSAERNTDDAANLDDEAWPRQRKVMRATQHGAQFVQAPEGVQKS